MDWWLEITHEGKKHNTNNNNQQRKNKEIEPEKNCLIVFVVEQTKYDLQHRFKRFTSFLFFFFWFLSCLSITCTFEYTNKNNYQCVFVAEIQTSFWFSCVRSEFGPFSVGIQTQWLTLVRWQGGERIFKPIRIRDKLNHKQMNNWLSFEINQNLFPKAYYWLLTVEAYKLDLLLAVFLPLLLFCSGFLIRRFSEWCRDGWLCEWNCKRLKIMDLRLSKSLKTINFWYSI